MLFNVTAYNRRLKWDRTHTAYVPLIGYIGLSVGFWILSVLKDFVFFCAVQCSSALCLLGYQFSH